LLVPCLSCPEMGSDPLLVKICVLHGEPHGKLERDLSAVQ